MGEAKLKEQALVPGSLLRAVVVLIVLMLPATSCEWVGRGKTRRLYIQLRQVCHLLLCHDFVYGSYPKSLAELETIATDSTICELEVSPLDELIETDPWGGPIHYRSTGAHYLLWSEGADRKMDDNWPIGSTPQDDRSKDTVLFDGLSIQWNEERSAVNCQRWDNQDENARRVFGGLIPALKAER